MIVCRLEEILEAIEDASASTTNSSMYESIISFSSKNSETAIEGDEEDAKILNEYE